MLTILLFVSYIAGPAVPYSALAHLMHGSIMVEFLFGALLAHLAGTRWRPSHGWAWVIAACMLAWVLNAAPFVSVLPRFLSGGVPAAMFFAGALALDATTTFPRWSIKLGDASYSLYLSHSLLVGGITNHVIALVSPTRLAPWSIVIAGCTAMLACILVGLVVHAVIEIPLLRAARRLGSRPPRAMPAPQLTAG